MILVPFNLMHSLAKEAEEKAKLVLLSKSNALRKAAKEKETALEKLTMTCPRRVQSCELAVIFCGKGKRTDSGKFKSISYILVMAFFKRSGKKSLKVMEF